jgi:hypothetical protein
MQENPSVRRIRVSQKLHRASCAKTTTDSSPAESAIRSSSPFKSTVATPSSMTSLNQMWQTGRPFVLHRYNKRMRRCRGCDGQFSTSNPSFVIKHVERKLYPGKKGLLCIANYNAIYHCRLGCILPLHPYFKKNEVTISADIQQPVDVDSVVM